MLHGSDHERGDTNRYANKDAMGGKRREREREREGKVKTL
jgi:hypothetical protein